MITSWTRGTEGRRRAGRRVLDMLTALALWVCVVLGDSLTTRDGAPPPPAEWPADALAALSCLALLASRRHPRAALVVTAVFTMITVTLGYYLTPLLLGPVMAGLYRLAARTDARSTHAYGFTTFAALICTSVITNPTDVQVAGPLLWLLLPLAWGHTARLQGAYLEAVQSRAEHAERTREEEARHRVVEERMRIARDLHDVVAHHMVLANLQARTAEYFARTRPEQSQKILAELTGTTSSALRELKATVGVLRQDDDPDSAPLEPAPGLDRLPELIAACESAGINVTVTTEGEPRPLSPGVDLTAFRIVQEALTNVTKHAASKAAHIRLDYAHTRLLITVTNEEAATVPDTAGSGSGRGFGLMGMRERAHSVGGELRAGPRAAGGFEVTTALPLHLAASEKEGTT
ncbi:sensor histidine kinase [Streptomyces adelaidensis]|uniref:sensor histidine kinase n=1 Tax=Streptomyces adelaidensis TaxID=2796465 RepID=UPI001903E279|nr:sensor histidine kinase [Streptomyces adelaidensis]